MAVFRLRASLRFTAPGLAAWARDQNQVRASMAKPVNAGRPHEERPRHEVVQGVYTADLPFPDQGLAEDTVATLLAVCTPPNLQVPTAQSWSWLTLHVCENTDPPRPCSMFLTRWTDRPELAAPVWFQPAGAHDAYALGAEVSHNQATWRSATAGNVWEPGVSGWEVV